jgi:hypothetical protein
MRFSDQFGLELTQGQLDFVDIDTTDDVRVYIDPSAIRIQGGDLAESCQALLQSYFHEVLAAIGEDDGLRIAELLRSLGTEPNETHLGQSVGPSRGRGLGPRRRQEIVTALASSEAARSGMLQDLEETTLFIRGLGRDFVSDMTTSVIRAPLIRYTQDMCALHGVPTESQWSGFMWDADALEWKEEMVLLPRGPIGKLLLVPKSFVRARLITNLTTYYGDFLRPLFEEEEMSANSELVFLLKDKRKKVLMKDLDLKYGTSKEDIERESQRRPEAMDSFRESLSTVRYPPYSNADFQEVIGTPAVDFDELVAPLSAIAPGPAGATAYHRAVAAILTALFDASVANMKIEASLHGQRKRLDIKYDNVAAAGFFHWLGAHFNAATIVVECKNFSADPANPELDQLIGRFSTDRGRVGLLLCRSFTNRALFDQRCRDTAQDDNGYVIALDDEDLRAMAAYASNCASNQALRLHDYPMLRQRFGVLIGEH